MDQQPAFTFQDLFTFVIRDMAKAISGRECETQEQQFARTRAAVHMILGFQPRDVIEAMLAGHCVMLHEVMTANVRTSLRGEIDPMRRGPRSNVVGLNKAFNDNLDRLERYRQRPAEGSREAPETSTLATPDNANPPPKETIDPRQPGPLARGPNRAARRQAARAEARTAAAASRAASQPMRGTPVQASLNKAQIAPSGPPSVEAFTACQANAEAMAALQSGDPAGFARAMGIAHPGEAFLAAANTKGSPFDPHSSGPWPTDVRAITPKS